MAKKPALSRRAAVALGALTAHVTPLLAADAAVDLRATVAGVTAATWSASKAKIAAAVTKATKGKLAADADLGDVVALLDKLDGAEPDGDETVETDPAAVDATDPAEGVLALLRGVVPDDVLAKVAEALKNFAPAAAASDVEVDPATKDDPAAKDEPPPFPPKKENDVKPEVTKAAMDAALAAVKADTIAHMDAIADAREAVRPYVGAVAGKVDSADAVYKFALDGFKAQGFPVDLAGLAPAAYGPLFRTLAPALKAARDKPRIVPNVAADAAAVSSYEAMFPGVQPARHA